MIEITVTVTMILIRRDITPDLIQRFQTGARTSVCANRILEMCQGGSEEGSERGSKGASERVCTSDPNVGARP